MTDQQPGPRGGAGVYEGLFADIGGVRQWITISGADRSAPALLALSGPGVALSRMRPLFAPWEADFTVVQWDQPGAGATWALNGAAGTGEISLGRLVRDGLAVAERVRERLGTPLALLGISGGSILGLEIIARRPDLFSAYAGAGQVVDWARQEAASYAMVLRQAEAAGDAGALAELRRIGPPPWADVADAAVNGRHANAQTPRELAAFAALAPSVMAEVAAPPPDAHWIAPGLPPVDQRARSLAVFETLAPEIAAFEARALGPRFEVPIVLLQGMLDAYATTPEVLAWAETITAPDKQVVLIDGAGHGAAFMIEEMCGLLTRRLRPLALDAGRRRR